MVLCSFWGNGFLKPALEADARMSETFAANVKMEVASEEKRENTTIIAGPGPQWPSVWFLNVPKSMEPLSVWQHAGGVV